MKTQADPSDSIELAPDEPIIFTDSPEGSASPAVEILAGPAAPAANDADSDFADEADPDASVGTFDADAEGDGQEAPRRPRRNRKDYQERINKLVRAQHEAEERAAAAEAARELAYQELQELRRQFRVGDPELLNERERAITDLKRQAIEAMDLGAYDLLNREELELRDARARLQAEQQRPRPAPPQPEEPLHPAAEVWLSRNPWVRDRANDALAARLVRLEAQLMQDEGLSPGDQLYRRLDEELLKLPEFDVVRGVIENGPTLVSEAVVSPASGRQRSVISQPGRGDLPPPARPDGAPRQLTDHDKRTMRMFRLDPGNPGHRASYLKYR